MLTASIVRCTGFVVNVVGFQTMTVEPTGVRSKNTPIRAKRIGRGKHENEAKGVASGARCAIEPSH